MTHAPPLGAGRAIALWFGEVAASPRDAAFGGP